MYHLIIKITGNPLGGDIISTGHYVLKEGAQNTQSGMITGRAPDNSWKIKATLNSWSREEEIITVNISFTDLYGESGFPNNLIVPIIIGELVPDNDNPNISIGILKLK